MPVEAPPSPPALPSLSWAMLEKSLGHANPLIREKALESAGRFPDVRAIAVLVAAFQSSDSRLQAAAARGLAESLNRRHPEAENALLDLLAGGAGVELRLFLISQLAGPIEGRLWQRLIEALADESPAVRVAVELVLQPHAGSWPRTAAAGAAFPSLEAARTAGTDEVQQAVAPWCELIRSAQVRRSFLETGQAAIQALSLALRCDSPLVRFGAICALAGRDDARSLPPLVDALRDRDISVRRAAAAGLARRGWQTGQEEERAWQLCALGRWTELGELGPLATEPLLHAARFSDEETQAQALGSLAALKSIRALRPLEEFLSASSARLRQAAARGLKALEWVPPGPGPALAQLLALEDWSGAVALGAVAWPGLAGELRASRAHEARAQAIGCALLDWSDVTAAPALIEACRDGEIASMAVLTLVALLQRQAGDFSENQLAEIAGLGQVVQFQFKLEQRTATLVRTGLELVSVEELKKLADAELTRRCTLALAGKETP